MKNLLSILLLLSILTACNEASDNTTDQTTIDEKQVSTPVEKTYIGTPVDRFEQAILNMEAEDSTRIRQENEVLFVGSSSIRLWSTLQPDFDPIPVINRGFGGSILPDVIHYADRIIFPYQPEVIVLYCGENDIANGASVEETFASFQSLDAMIRQKLPESRMIYISMKPSVARWDIWDKYQQCNAKIKAYLAKQSNREYLDCSTVMLQENGQADSTIYVEDMLHMNAKGYEAWAQLIRPEVEKMYQNN